MHVLYVIYAQNTRITSSQYQVILICHTLNSHQIHYSKKSLPTYLLHQSVEQEVYLSVIPTKIWNSTTLCIRQNNIPWTCYLLKEGTSSSLITVINYCYAPMNIMKLCYFLLTLRGHAMVRGSKNRFFFSSTILIANFPLNTMLRIAFRNSILFRKYSLNREITFLHIQ